MKFIRHGDFMLVYKNFGYMYSNSCAPEMFMHKDSLAYGCIPENFWVNNSSSIILGTISSITDENNEPVFIYFNLFDNIKRHYSFITYSSISDEIKNFTIVSRSYACNQPIWWMFTQPEVFFIKKCEVA